MKKILWVKFGWFKFYRGGPVDGNFSYLAGKGKKGHEALCDGRHVLLLRRRS